MGKDESVLRSRRSGSPILLNNQGATFPLGKACPNDVPAEHRALFLSGDIVCYSEFFFSLSELCGPADTQPETLPSASSNPLKPNSIHVQTVVASPPVLITPQEDASKEDVIFF